MDKSIRVALIYKKDYNFFNKSHFDQTTNDFFMKALKRNERLKISYFPCDNEFDVKKLTGKCDIILLVNNRFDATPENLHGIKESTIPIITKTGDPHYAKKYNQIELHEKYLECLQLLKDLLLLVLLVLHYHKLDLDVWL